LAKHAPVSNDAAPRAEAGGDKPRPYGTRSHGRQESWRDGEAGRLADPVLRAEAGGDKPCLYGTNGATRARNYPGYGEATG